MSHDQREWVRCRQYSLLIFQFKSLVHSECFTLIQSDICLLRYDQFFEVQNNINHRHFSPILAYNSESIFPTSDSFPLIMSHIGILIIIKCKEIWLLTGVANDKWYPNSARAIGYLISTYVMLSSKMSRKLQILIWRYSETKQIISFVFLCFCNHSKFHFSRTNCPISMGFSPN